MVAGLTKCEKTSRTLTYYIGGQGSSHKGGQTGNIGPEAWDATVKNSREGINHVRTILCCIVPCGWSKCRRGQLMNEAAKSEGIASKLGAWIVIYGIYLFLAGWTYLDYYFAIFGINAKWLKFELNDVIARGFTVLFDAGAWLSIVYVIVLGISLIVEIFKKKSGSGYAVVAIGLVIGFFPTYCISKHAGMESAKKDRGPTSTLATITFTQKGCTYRGKLVYINGETL